MRFSTGSSFSAIPYFCVKSNGFSQFTSIKAVREVIKRPLCPQRFLAVTNCPEKQGYRCILSPKNTPRTQLPDFPNESTGPII